MRKGGYYVNNTLLKASGQVNGWTSKQVNCEERQSNEGSRQGNEWTSKQVNCEERQSNKGSRQGNELIVKEDKVTGEQG